MSYKITDTIIVDNNKNIGSIGTALFAGPVIIGGGTSTGTVSQPLQVTGTNGAYIGGNLGIGSTNPSSKLWVNGDIYATGIVTAQVLNASKDPGTGIATDFTNSLFGNGWRVSAPGSTTYYKLATLPPGDGGSTFDHLIINGILGAWTNGNQTPFEITFSNRGSFNYKYVSYGSVRSDVRIIGISTNSSVEIWAQHQASQFTKLVYNIPNSIESIVVSNPTSTTTAPTGTTVFDSSTATPRFIINESDYVGIGTATPQSALDVRGTISIGRTDASTVNSIRSVTDINSWEYGGVSLLVSGQDTSPQDIYFKDDGTKMFILGDTGNDVNEYALSTAWEVNTATFTTVFSVASQETNPLGLYFKPDGSRMYICGSTAVSPSGADQVRSYTLSNPWDISTGVTYDSKAYTVSDTAPQGVYFKDDGLKMYVVGSTGDALYEYSLLIAWELDSTITLLNTVLLGTGNTLNLPLSLTGPTGIDFNASGTKMYITDAIRDVVARFDLSTPWDTTTTTFYDNVYVGFQELTPNGIFYQEDQSKAYIVGSGSDTVFQYNTDVPSLELASSGITTRTSVIINNEARLNNRLYVTGDTHVSGNTNLKGTLTVDSTTTVAGTLSATGAVTASTTTGAINFGTSQTTGTLILGGTSQTGTITLGQATVSQTTNIQAGATASGNTKTINFGTGGLAGSFTQINIGPTAGVGTITVNSGTNLLIGTGTSTGTASQRLQVDGGAYVSGSVGIGTTNPKATLQVKDARAFETTNTTTTSTSQVAVDTFATATFRSAKYQVQITCPGQLATLGGITTGGSGYTAGTFNVTFSNSSGTGAAAQGTLTISNGTVSQIGIGTTGGSGYAAGDVLTASGGSGLQVSVASTASPSGRILTLGSITSAGVGYTAGVGVGTTTLAFLGGTGTGAVGLATIFDGVITSATLLQQPTTGTGGTVYYSGSNYTTSTILTIAKSDVTNTITDITGSVGVSTFTSLTAHGIGVSDVVRVSSTSNGLTAGTDYYVVTIPSTTTFTLGSSVGIGTTFTTGSSLSIGFYRNSSIAGGSVAYLNAITGVSTNYQVSDLLVLQNGTTADYVEYGTIANNDVLGTFAADISGANARLLLTPTYATNTVKVARQVMTV